MGVLHHGGLLWAVSDRSNKATWLTTKNANGEETHGRPGYCCNLFIDKLGAATAAGHTCIVGLRAGVGKGRELRAELSDHIALLERPPLCLRRLVYIFTK